MNRGRHPIKRTTRGFTLLEMMAVIFIIGLLVGLGGLTIMNQINKARVNTAKAQIATFDQAIELFQMDNGRFPTMEEGLDALVHAPGDAVDYPAGGYLKMSAVPKDPWNNDYQYLVRTTENGQEYIVFSYGEGGQLGGEGYARDIASRGEDPANWIGGY